MLVRYAMLAGVFALLCFFVGRYIQYNLDSDMSSELLLSRILADEGKLITSSWLYSSELRVLDDQLFFLPFFALGIESWHTVRVAGTILAYVLLMLGLWFFCESTGLGKSFPLIGILFLLPYSDMYSNVLFGTYYIPHILIALVTLGLIFRCSSSGKAVAFQTLNMLLAVCAGLGGFRKLVTLYLPLVMAALLELWSGEQKKKDFSLLGKSLLLFLSAGLGALINRTVLSQNYSFQNFTIIQLKDFSLDGLEKLIKSVLQLLGFQSWSCVSSVAGICGLGAIFLVFAGVLACIHIVRNKEDYSRELTLITYFFLAGLLVFFLILSLTDMGFISRHLIPVLVFAFPVVIAAFDGKQHPKPLDKAFPAVLIAVILLCGALTYNDMRQKDHTVNLRTVGDKLQEQGYDEGYAGFWKANVLTELTDGKIEVWHWNDWNKKERVYRWLQASSHLDTPPEGKVFLLLSETEEEESELPEQLEEYFLFRTQYYDRLGTDNYVAYGFDSREEMLAVLGKE
ncbi:MAG: hypothetical protein ACI4O0_03585 [Candidatus Limivicinus sp.]